MLSPFIFHNKIFRTYNECERNFLRKEGSYVRNSRLDRFQQKYQK